VLGAGKPLFKELKERKWLTLLDSKIYANGLVSLRYKMMWN
jgi:hypothetical protein